MTAATVSFGAYMLQSFGNDLLICCGNSPGNENGCQIFKSEDGVNFVHEFAPDEQGSNIDGQMVGDEFWMCGQDPDPDDWTLGNLYHRDGEGTWTKLRTLPFTIHALGLWYSSSTILVVGGMHTGDNATWKGRVLKSVDNGRTWVAVDVNNYRLYDVIGFDGKLYVVGYDWTGKTYTQDLHVSEDGGAIWSKISDVTPAIKPRLLLHNGVLVGALNGLMGVFEIQSGGSVIQHPVSFTIANNWNVLESDGTHLYVLANNGRVWRTTDFSAWEAYTQVANAISIKWWAGRGLMISDMGTAARVWVA